MASTRGVITQTVKEENMFPLQCYTNRWDSKEVPSNFCPPPPFTSGPAHK